MVQQHNRGGRYIDTLPTNSLSQSDRSRTKKAGQPNGEVTLSTSCPTDRRADLGGVGSGQATANR